MLYTFNIIKYVLISFISFFPYILFFFFFFLRNPPPTDFSPFPPPAPLPLPGAPLRFAFIKEKPGRHKTPPRRLVTACSPPFPPGRPPPPLPRRSRQSVSWEHGFLPP